MEVLEAAMVPLEKIRDLNLTNMVAERRLTAMMLQEAIRLEWVRSLEYSKEKRMAVEVALTGLEFSPSTMPNLERAVLKGQKESTAVGPDLPFWGSSGGLGGG